MSHEGGGEALGGSGSRAPWCSRQVVVGCSLVLLCSWLLVLTLQWKAGAYQAEFGGNSDEAAHYVTGLLVRDYLADLVPGNPLEYAQNYYLHYPKIAFGHWPPLFYVVQAAWTLPFSPSRGSVLLLMALLAATVAATLFQVIRAEYSWPAGVAAALLLISLPMIQEYSREVMAEMLQVVLVFWAVLTFGRYLDKPDLRSAVWFAALASLAILNKGTGIVLAAVPPLSLLITRRFRLVGSPSFWLPAILVAVVCSPWYLLQPGAMHQSSMPSEYLFVTSEWDLPQLNWVSVLGLWLVPFSLIGMAVRIVKPLLAGEQISGRWAAAMALLVGIPLVRIWISPLVEVRHTIVAIPFLLMFLMAGLSWLSMLPRGRSLPSTARLAIISAAGAIICIVNVYSMPAKVRTGFSQIAADLVGRPELENSVLLISSGELGEGMFISEVAMREERPGHIVLRGSKALATSNWWGAGYQLRYKTPAEVMRFLESVPVGVIVFDRNPLRVDEDHRLVREVLKTYAEEWDLVETYRQAAGSENAGRTIDVYRLKGHESRTPSATRIEAVAGLESQIVRRRTGSRHSAGS